MELKASIIVAVGENREIGKAGELLWHIPADLRRFKEITLGHNIVMGRKTFQSIGRPLPGRTNIVISQNLEFHPERCLVAHSLEEALLKVDDNKNTFIIGGGQVYEQAISLVNRLYLTLVEGKFSGADTFFPDYSDFKKVISETFKEDAGYKFKFLELER